MAAAPTSPALQVRARWHERRLYAASHPFLYALSTWAAWRGPLVTVPGVGHLVSDPALAREVLATPVRFAKTGPGAFSDRLRSVIGPYGLVNMDGEGHRLLRTRLQGLFSPHDVAALILQVFAPVLAALCDRLRRGDPVDLVQTAQALTGRMACAILGVPLVPGREELTCLDLYRLATDFAGALGLSASPLQGRRLARLHQRFEALTAVARDAFERGDDGTVPGRLRALGLDFEESRGVIGLLFLVGTETTASALPRIVALLLDTGQWPLLQQQRALMPVALDEGLRVTAGVPIVTRNVVSATRLGRRQLAADERVIVLLFKALLSDTWIDRPLHFDLLRDRSTAPAPLWFGQGPHLCLGAALARAEIAATLDALLDVGPLSVVERRYSTRGLMPAYGRLLVELALGDGPATA